jgi:hypothetical protein
VGGLLDYIKTPPRILEIVGNNKREHMKQQNPTITSEFPNVDVSLWE